MKQKLDLVRITKKNMADVITLTGVAAILGVVVFATTNDIPAGEMAYQNYGWDVWPLFSSFAVCYPFV